MAELDRSPGEDPAAVPESAVSPDQRDAQIASASPRRQLLALLFGPVAMYAYLIYRGWPMDYDGYIPSVAEHAWVCIEDFVIFGGWLFLVLYFVAQRNLRSLDTRPSNGWADFLEGFALFVGLWILAGIFNTFTEGVLPPTLDYGQVEWIMAQLDQPLYLLIDLLLFNWLVAAVIEEFMRAFFLSQAQPFATTKAAQTGLIFLSAVLFGFVHIYQGVAGVLSATLFGLVLGVYYIKRGRIVPMILAHGLYNTFVSLNGYFWGITYREWA